MKMTNESMVIFQNGSEIMRDSFRKQIYDLLEQSKKENKKKPIDILQGKFKHFTGDVELDDENKNPFRVKKVDDKYKFDFVNYDEWEKMMANLDEGDKEEWEKNAKELRDLISKVQKRIEREKELGEEVKTENKRKSIKQIISDLVETLSFHQVNMKQVDSDYYLYDRMEFLKRHFDLDREVDTYWIDLESLATLIIQIHKYSHIILRNKEGKDFYTNKVLNEGK